MTVTGESMEHDGQAQARMTTEHGDTAHADFAASSVKRFVLSVAQVADNGIEAKPPTSGSTLTSPAGKAVSAKKTRSLFLPAGGADRASGGRGGVQADDGAVRPRGTPSGDNGAERAREERACCETARTLRGLVRTDVGLNTAERMR